MTGSRSPDGPALCSLLMHGLYKWRSAIILEAEKVRRGGRQKKRVLKFNFSQVTVC